MSCNHDTFIFRTANGHRICARCRIPMTLEGERWVPEIATRPSAYNLAARDLAKDLIELRRQVSRCQGLLETSIRHGSVINAREFTMLLDEVNGGIQHHITRFALLPREEATS